MREEHKTEKAPQKNWPSLYDWLSNCHWHYTS